MKVSKNVSFIVFIFIGCVTTLKAMDDYTESTPLLGSSSHSINDHLIPAMDEADAEYYSAIQELLDEQTISPYCTEIQKLSTLYNNDTTRNRILSVITKFFLAPRNVLYPILMKTITVNTGLFSGDWITSVALSAEGRFVVVCSSKPNAKVIDLANNTLIDLNTEDVKSFIFASAISPDGKYVAIADLCNVIICDTETKKRIQTLKHKAPIASIAIMPDNNTIITLSKNKQIKSWNLFTGQCLGKRTSTVDISTGSLSATGRFCVNAYPSLSHITKLDLHTGKSVNITTNCDKACSSAISTHGEIIVIGNKKNNLTAIYDLQTQGHMYTVGASKEACIFSVAISANEKFLMTGSSDGTATIFDLAWHRNLSFAQLILIIKMIDGLRSKKSFNMSSDWKTISIPTYIKDNLKKLAHHGDKSSTSYLTL